MTKYLILALVISLVVIGFSMRGKVEAANQESQPAVLLVDTGSEDMMGGGGGTIGVLSTGSIAEVSPTPLEITPAPLDKETVTRQGDPKTFLF